MGQVTMTENDVLIATTEGGEQGQRSNVTQRERNGSFFESTSLFYSSPPGLC